MKQPLFLLRGRDHNVERDIIFGGVVLEEEMTMAGLGKFSRISS